MQRMQHPSALHKYHLAGCIVHVKLWARLRQSAAIAAESIRLGEDPRDIEAGVSSKNALEREIERRNRFSRATRNIPDAAAAAAAAPPRRSIAISYPSPRIRDRFRSKDRDGVTSRFTRPGSINRNILRSKLIYPLNVTNVFLTCHGSPDLYVYEVFKGLSNFGENINI